MGKLFRNIFLTLAALIMMASGVQAAAPAGSWIDISAAGVTSWDDDSTTGGASGPYLFGSEWLSGQTTVLSVDLGSAVLTPGGGLLDRSDIVYKPAISMGINNTIKLTMTNGAIKSNGGVYYLWHNELNVAAASMIDFVANADGDYTSMTFQFLQTALASDPAMVVGSTASLTRTAAAPAAGVNRPILAVRSTTLGTGMTIQVSEARDASSNMQTAPLTNIKTVVKSTAQLSAKVQYLTGVATYADGNATSVIDVECLGTSRSKFVVEAAKDTPTITTSTAAVLLANATVNNGIVVAAAGYTLTLTGDQAAILNITGVKINGTNLVRTTGTSWAYTGALGTAGILTVPTTNDILITVDGTTVINTATYTVSLVITPAEAGVAPVTSIPAGTTAFVWTVNAMQARIPYMLVETGGTNYSGFITISNRNSQDALLSVDLVISDATASVAKNIYRTAENVLILKANSVTVIREADLDAWFADLDDTQVYRVALTLTVVAPQNTVDVTAFHVTGANRTAVPVLYNTNNAGDGRVWQ